MNLSEKETSPSQQPFDPVLSPLLDRALAADPVPVDLAQRIFMATRGRLPQARGIARLTSHLGAIGLRRARALAAGIVLACSVGILLATSGILRDAHATAQAKEDIASLSGYQGPQAAIDQEISQLARRIDAVAPNRAYADTDAARAVNALEALVPAKTSYPSSQDNPVNLF